MYFGQFTLRTWSIVQHTFVVFDVMVIVCFLFILDYDTIMPDITVTDSQHPTHLVEELVVMRKNGEFFDYVINGSKKTFQIHSLVLACMSPVFKAMLRSNMEETTNKEATFPSIPDDIMSKVIDYAYDGVCTFSDDQLMNLIKAAHYLQMPKLLDLCEAKITSMLNASNCFSWLRLTDSLQLKSVLPQVQKMMRTSYRDIILTEEFQTLDMTELVHYFTDAREHGIHSDELLSGVIAWVERDTENRPTHMQELFTVVSVGKCSEKCIVKTMEEHAELLDKQHNVYKLLLSEVLNNQISKVLGEGKTVIILGGQSHSNCVNTDCWILQDDKMIPFSKISGDFEVKLYHSVCQIPDGLMITGGNNTDLCLVFRISLKSWVKEKPLPNIRDRHASCFNGGKVFLIGGYTGVSLTCTVDIMDLKSSTWSDGPSFPKTCNIPKVVALNKALYVLLSGTCEMYRLDTNKMSWSAKSPLPQSSNGCSLAASGGRIFAAGGESRINCMYIPTTNMWCCLTGPTLNERHGSLVYYQQKLYLFGGCSRDNPLRDVEEYDITADKWSLTKWKLPMPLKCFLCISCGLSPKVTHMQSPQKMHIHTTRTSCSQICHLYSRTFSLF